MPLLFNSVRRKCLKLYQNDLFRSLLITIDLSGYLYQVVFIKKKLFEDGNIYNASTIIKFYIYISV